MKIQLDEKALIAMIGGDSEVEIEELSNGAVLIKGQDRYVTLEKGIHLVSKDRVSAVVWVEEGSIKLRGGRSGMIIFQEEKIS